MWRLFVLLLAAAAHAQIPSLGWCPDYQPMANFNINRFLGNWFEAERYFTVSELGTRCVNTKYEATPEGRIVVSNEITNSLTGMKRVLDGTLQMIGREGEGRMMVKYASLPVPYDTEFSILDTDYENFAVMWSCSGIGPVHIQNAWILTRERLPPPMIMQSAYGVLDKYKISRTFFVKTNQADCHILPRPAAEPMLDLLKSSDDVEGKNAAVPEVVVEKDDKSPEIKNEVILERSAVPEMPEEAKPMKMSEPMKDSEKKDEKMDKPMEMKEEMKKPELEMKEKIDMPMQ
ncbi:apolipoprotein D-like [Zerene cesonia]|uniref:apolipoprotein D-like n=1 Tax=Zerene cesonia TaxID=33412 RepID=UPI0018E52E75|nr:apolipoprotein D-like [Zerene cesonia]